MPFITWKSIRCASIVLLRVRNVLFHIATRVTYTVSAKENSLNGFSSFKRHCRITLYDSKL